MLNFLKKRPKEKPLTIKEVLQDNNVKEIIDSLAERSDEIKEMIVVCALKNGDLWVKLTDMTREHTLWLIETNKNFIVGLEDD